jgi:glycosyltransferase involved in cell wall biosynthesis
VLLRRHAISPSKKIILTVARFAASEKYKGYDQIIRALPKILAAIPHAHYVLVGEGQDRSRIEQLISSLGVSKSVTLPGSVTDAELPDYYNLCDVFAMPSKGEGFGIVYLEALSCGKPVLAGNMDGSSDPLQNGQLGVLVNPDNIAEIAQALIAILQRTYPLPVLYRGDQLRERTIQAFGPDRFFGEVKRQLDELLLELPRARHLRSPEQATRCLPAQG